MNTPYETKTISYLGKDYRIAYFYDTDAGLPWEECDCYGVVSEWTRRDKKPSERILDEVRGGFRRFYDVHASLDKARRDEWGINGDTHGMTKRQIRALAVEHDFKNLQGFCMGDWRYIGIECTEILTDKDGFEYDGFQQSLWGIESNSGDYLREVEQDLCIAVTHDRYVSDNKRAA